MIFNTMAWMISPRDKLNADRKKKYILHILVRGEVRIENYILD